MQIECDCHDLRWSRCTASWFRRECLGLNNNCAAALRLLGRKQRKSSCLGWKITISNKRGQSHTTPGLAAFHLNSIFDCNEVTKMCNFLDAIASPSTYPCQWVSGSLIVSDLEIAITSLSFASLFAVQSSGFSTCVETGYNMNI